MKKGAKRKLVARRRHKNKRGTLALETPKARDAGEQTALVRWLNKLRGR